MNNILPVNALGIGVDLVEIARIKGLLEKHKVSFLHKVFTEEEQAYCFEKKDPSPSLAVRFAAKEAVSKAFGCGIGQELDWKSVGVHTSRTGQPSIILDSKGQQLLLKHKATHVLISLSHTASYAQAFAILVGDRKILV